MFTNSPSEEPLTDFDLEATAQARPAPRGLTIEPCGVCTKPMYQEAAYPGVPTEWKHRSSGHALSYMPSKHIAGPEPVHIHQHRFGPAQKDGRKACEVSGCDSILVARVKEQPDAEPVRSDKEQREHESRKRGAVKGHESASKRAREKKHGRQIPF